MQRVLNLAGLATLSASLMASAVQAGTLPSGAQLGAPTLTITADDKEFITEGRQNPAASTLWDFSIQMGGEADGFILSGTGTIDQDPSVSYAIAVTDFGAPTTFSIQISTPIVTGPYTHALATLSGELTDSTGDGVSASPMQTSSGLPLQSLGVDVNLSCSTAGACGSDSAESYEDFSALTGLQTTLVFTGSGGGDQFIFTGSTLLDTKPRPTNEVAEPAMPGLLIGSMLALFASGSHRRVRKAAKHH